MEGYEQTFIANNVTLNSLSIEKEWVTSCYYHAIANILHHNVEFVRKFSRR